MEDIEVIQLRVSEIFRSIQGESTFAGLPCVFVRLCGCNLHCRYCDTAYARVGGELMSAKVILDRVQALGTGLVEVTGGEPLMQEATPRLLELLVGTGRTVLLETNGSRPIPRHRGFHAIMDLKCPSSGESGAMCWENLARMTPDDQVKFVVAERADFAWVLEIVSRYGLDERGIPLLVAPVHGELPLRILAEWLLDAGAPLRLQPQLHKLIWPERDRGV